MIMIKVLSSLPGRLYVSQVSHAIINYWNRINCYCKPCSLSSSSCSKVLVSVAGSKVLSVTQIRPRVIDFLFRVRRDLTKSGHPEKKGKVRFQKVRFQKKFRLRRAFWISHGFKQTNISTTKLHQSMLS